MWQEYLETVVRERDGWGRCTEPAESCEPHGLRDPPPRTRLGPRRRTGARELQPDAVLIEGPPECDALLPLAPRGRSRRSRCSPTFPTTGTGRVLSVRAFSPEWRAIRYAQDHDVPVRFMDLPAADKMADADDEPRRGLRADPLAALAEVAGHGDPERWWEDVVESRHGAAPSRRSPRRWRRCARRSRSTRRARSGARRTCASRSAPRRRREPRTSPWSAAPGTRPRSPSSAPRRPTSARSRPARRSRWRPPGAVDLRPARARQRLRRRRRLARPGTTSLRRHGSARSRAGSRARRGCCAPKGWTRPPRRWSTPRGWRARWPASASGRWPASTSCSTRPARCCVSAPTCRSRSSARELSSATGSVRSRAETPMVPLQQDVARMQRRLRLKPEAERQGAHAGFAPPERPRAQQAPAPAQSARGAVGHARVRERRAGDVQRGVPARVAAVARARPDPREPLGDERSRRRRRRRRARKLPGRRASPRSRRSPTRSCSPICRRRSRTCCKRCPIRPRWTVTPPT